MMGKAEYMYRCECSRVFDSKETYERGLIPLYGKDLKPLYTKGGHPIIDKNGNQVYQKCHICRRHTIANANTKTTLVDRILEYLDCHEFITSDDYQAVGATTKRSFATTANGMVGNRLIQTQGFRSKPQKYKLREV